jgi:hypothetical protein
VEVIERAGWGAAAATGPYTSHAIARLTVHHTAVEIGAGEGPAQLRSVQRFHQGERGWEDIAYHLLIDREGNVFEGRPVDAVGDTATSYDPAGHLLACLLGDYDRQEPTAAQMVSLVRLLAWASGAYSVLPESLGGHRDYAATACPGASVYRLIEDGSLLAAMQAQLSAGGTSLVYLRGQEAIDRVEQIEKG